jgi:chloramphenicol-sensitive protein RarD
MNKKLGIFYSIACNIAFIVLGIITSFAQDMGALNIAALRVIGAVVVLLPIFVVFYRGQAEALLKMGCSEWAKSLATSLILGLNIWLFAAAPLWGDAASVAHGYLLLPIFLAALDIFRREPTPVLTYCGIGFAILGIAHTLWSAPHFSWVSLAIAMSQTLYFYLHKKRSLSLMQRAISDFIWLAPLCVLSLSLYGGWAAASQHWGYAASFGAITAVAYLFYLGASKELSHTVFGILMLLEPIGLAVVAVVLYRKDMSYLDMSLMGLGALLVCMPTKKTFEPQSKQLIHKVAKSQSRISP